MNRPSTCHPQPRAPAAPSSTARLDPSLDLLDLLDQPLMMVDPDLQLLWANAAASGRLAVESAGLALDAQGCLTTDPPMARRLRSAVADAIDLDRRTVVFGWPIANAESAIAIVPVAGLDGALLLLGRDRVVSSASLESFARAIGLTPSEVEVLQGICEGGSPEAVARRRGVSLYTVRAQLASLRMKTETPDLRALLLKVAALPSLAEPSLSSGPAVRSRAGAPRWTSSEGRAA